MAIPNKNIVDEVKVPPLVIHLDSLQAQCRAKLEEPEVARFIKEVVGKVESHLEYCQGGTGKSRRGRRLGLNEAN